MDFFVNILQEYPAIALFLTIGLGFWLGRLRIGTFTVGSVTAVLIVAVIIGQLNIPLSPQLKSIFFMLFLFSVGYSVGPKFFRSLRGMGLKQVAFALLMSLTCFGVTVGLVYLFAYNAGEAVGLFSGSQTCSAVLGVGSDAINNFVSGGLISAQDAQDQINIMPVCYAVTYIYGTLGTVIILGTIGPKLLGGLEFVRKDTAELEAELDDRAWMRDPVNINAFRQVSYRAFLVNMPAFKDGITAQEVELNFRKHGATIYVDRIRRAVTGEILNASLDTKIYTGDTVVLCGRREYVLDHSDRIGDEVTDKELLEYPVRHTPLLLVSRKITGLTVKRLREMSFMRGVVIEEITRSQQPVEVTPDTVLEMRDTLILVGQRENLKRAVDELGYMDKPTRQTDLMYVGLALFIGGIFGALPFVIDGIPVSFGTSGGALVAGLFFGWLRTRRPSIGKIPESALWLLNHLGLNVFIAVIGIDAAPSFVSGLSQLGAGLLIAGAIGTTIPLFVGLWLGHKVFKFHPALTLGCCAGTRTCTAALGAVQESLGSTLPVMGYTVTYAVSNIMLVIWGLITVILSV